MGRGDGCLTAGTVSCGGGGGSAAPLPCFTLARPPPPSLGAPVPLSVGPARRHAGARPSAGLEGWGGGGGIVFAQPGRGSVPLASAGWGGTGRACVRPPATAHSSSSAGACPLPPRPFAACVINNLWPKKRWEEKCLV